LAAESAGFGAWDNYQDDAIYHLIIIRRKAARKERRRSSTRDSGIGKRTLSIDHFPESYQELKTFKLLTKTAPETSFFTV
jgi:hypothetical protein